MGSLACMKTLLPLALMVALAAAPATANAKTLVSFEQSGGIAGVDVTVAVTTTGHVTGDVKGARSHRLRAATLRHLRALLADGPLGPREPGPSHCADCFAYVVRYHGHRASYDDSQSSRSRARCARSWPSCMRISRGGR